MKNPTRKQLEAMTKLANDDNFKVFMEWVSDSYLFEAVQSTSIAQEPQRTWMQGRVQQLGVVLETVAKSRETLDAVERSGET